MTTITLKTLPFSRDYPVEYTQFALPQSVCNKDLVLTIFVIRGKVSPSTKVELMHNGVVEATSSVSSGRFSHPMVGMGYGQTFIGVHGDVDSIDLTFEQLT